MFDGRTWYSPAIILVFLLLAAGCQEPAPPVVTAECNPVPVSQPPLPDIVESVTFQDLALHGPIHSLNVVGGGAPKFG